LDKLSHSARGGTVAAILFMNPVLVVFRRNAAIPSFVTILIAEKKLLDGAIPAITSSGRGPDTPIIVSMCCRLLEKNGNKDKSRYQFPRL